MKATGIVRRMDDLGRVVIPKEIRRTMKIGEGTPLEIFIDKEGGIIFRKYSPVGEMSESAQRMSECVSSLCGAGVAVSDRDRIVASAGIPKKELLDKPISRQIEELMKKRKPFISSGEDTVLAADGGLRTANAAFPILSEGDIVGCVVSAWQYDTSTNGKISDEIESKLVQTAGMFLGKQMES